MHRRGSRIRGARWLAIPVLPLVAAVILAAVGVVPSQPRVIEAAQVVSGPWVTNVTDTSFVVTWVTSTPSDGHVEYGTESGSYPSRANDERGEDYVGYTHFVRIAGLLGAGTKYYYRVIAGDSTLDSPSTYYVVTGPTASPTDEFIVDGYIQKTDGSDAPDALVYVFPQREENSGTPSRMVWLAVLTESDGYFSVDLGEARAATSTERTVGNAFGELVAGDRVRYRAIGGIRAGGALNDTNWQSEDLTEAMLDEAAVSLDPLALPYAEEPTPSPSPTSTPIRTETPTPPAPSPTPTLARTSTATPTALPATATNTPAPALAATTPTPATRATATSPAIAPTASDRKSTVTPPRATPRLATPTSAPASGAIRPGASSPTARPTEVAASPTPIPFPTGDESAPIPDGLRALLVVAALLLTGGLGMTAVGVYQGMRRRAA